MKKILAIAAIALLCVPAFVSCKKDKKGSKSDSNEAFLSIGEEEKSIAGAYFLYNPSMYFLTVQTEEGLSLEFILDKDNKGKRIDLLQPDPLAPKAVTQIGGVNYYHIIVYNLNLSPLRFELANGDPESKLQIPLGEGSYMQIDEKDDKIVLDFELIDCPASAALGDGGQTIVGHFKGFEEDSISEDAQ